MWKGKKRSKDPRQMISSIRKFLSGEDVVKEILEKTNEEIVIVKIGPSWKDGSVTDEDTSEAGGVPSWWGNTNAHVVIMEPFEKTYPDPEIEGVSYQNALNVPKIEDIPERTNSSKKIERPETAAIKPVKRIEKPKPTQAEIDEQERQARVEANRLHQEKILKIREEFNWHDVPFSNWINQLGRR